MAQVDYVRMPQLGNAIGKYRVMHKSLGLPQAVAAALIRTAKFCVNPSQASARRQMARRVLAEAGDIARIPEDDGFLLLERDRFPGMTAALDAARAAFDTLDRDGTVERLQAASNKRFLVAAQWGTDFLRHPEILSFMVSRPVVDTATAYLGSVPMLSGAALWWTPPNDTEDRSQLFHRDAEDSRQLKFFLNCRDVTEDAGPLTFLPAALSDRIRRGIGYVSGRLTDEAVDAAGGAGRHLRATGPADTGIVLDTSRSLHFGSRRNSAGRLVLMFQFTSFYAPKSVALDWADGLGATGIELDAVQKMVLGVA